MSTTTEPSVRFSALGTTALVAVTDGAALGVAERTVRRTLVEIDEACSRFRADSELSRLAERGGQVSVVSPLLAEALGVALRAAALTDGLVTPTVGDALRDLGYDRDFAEIGNDAARSAVPSPARPWWHIRCDTGTRQVIVPRGMTVDLGATAKAFAADLAAMRAASATGAGVLVSLGGDIAVTGTGPDEGWLIALGDDHELADVDPAATVTIRSGGLATSSITRRRWRAGNRWVHHIVDPRTGDAVDPVWRTVSVAAGSCVDANVAATAAMLLGEGAPDWLRRRDLPARLVGVAGDVVPVAGWPDDALERSP
jgi:thiamine biosynthesis lipoprotein